MADSNFAAPSSIYRSSWIVAEYKRRGGTYSGAKRTSSGLRRWYREGWVDLNRPARGSSAFEPCGRKSAAAGGKYPLCRPSRRITAQTPRTYKEIPRGAIKRAQREKEKWGSRARVSFGAKPRAVKARAVKPRAVKSRAVKPRAVKSRAVKSRAVKPRAVKPRAVKPRAVKPRAVKPRAVKPRAVKPRAVKPRAVKPRAVKPRVAPASLLKRR